MRRLCVGMAVLALLPAWAGSADRAPSRADPESCPDCHRPVQEAFAASAMARAAATPDFVREWGEAGRPGRCLECHAPTGGAGVACVDCHEGPGHPFPPVPVPAACARCHDAPGESTVRRFRESPARRRGEDCLDCHTEGGEAGFSHRFVGPAVEPGALAGVASLRAVLRFSPQSPFSESPRGRLTAVVAVRHRAGHALPGGTTGRAVWLQVTGVDGAGNPRWRRRFRFGWEHDRRGNWRDRTLPPGRPRVLELPAVDRAGTRRLRLELWYRFRPGPFTLTDPRAVLLDRMERALPAAEGG